MRETTQALELMLIPVEARGLDALEQAFATMVRERTEAFVVQSDGVLFNCRSQIGVMACVKRLLDVRGRLHGPVRRLSLQVQRPRSLPASRSTFRPRQL